MEEPGVVKTSAVRAVGIAASDDSVCRAGQLRYAEIENLGVAALSYKNICRLDVAMRDVSCVCRIKRVGDLYAQSDSLLLRHRLSVDSRTERLAV